MVKRSCSDWPKFARAGKEFRRRGPGQPNAKDAQGLAEWPSLQPAVLAWPAGELAFQGRPGESCGSCRAFRGGVRPGTGLWRGSPTTPEPAEPRQILITPAAFKRGVSSSRAEHSNPGSSWAPCRSPWTGAVFPRTWRGTRRCRSSHSSSPEPGSPDALMIRACTRPAGAHLPFRIFGSITITALRRGRATVFERVRRSHPPGSLGFGDGYA